MPTDKQITALIVFGILIALLGVMLAVTAQETADINNVFAIVVNNTDLGSMGTQERLSGVTYWANNSPLQIEVITHTVNTGQDIVFNFSINGTQVWQYSKRSAVADEHHSMMQIVPKGANYTFFNSTSIHHYEWREYPILSGKNGTLSINNTFGYNASYVTYNQTTGNLNMSPNNIIVGGYINFTSATGKIYNDAGTAYLSLTDSLFTGAGLVSVATPQTASISSECLFGSCFNEYDVTDSTKLLNTTFTQSPSGYTLKLNTTTLMNINNTGIWVYVNGQLMQLNGSVYPNSTNFMNNTMFDRFESGKVNKSGGTMTGDLVINLTGNFPANEVSGDYDSNFLALTNNNATSTAASVSFNLNTNGNQFLFQNHASQRTISRYGKVLGGWAEMRKTSGNGTIIGVETSSQVIIGTNGNARANFTETGNLTIETVGKGIILRSPDGTKCGILTWSNANSLASTAITCP